MAVSWHAWVITWVHMDSALNMLCKPRLHTLNREDFCLKVMQNAQTRLDNAGITGLCKIAKLRLSKQVKTSQLIPQSFFMDERRQETIQLGFQDLIDQQKKEATMPLRIPPTFHPLRHQIWRNDGIITCTFTTFGTFKLCALK